MATHSTDFLSNPYLSKDQQSLLVTALNSNKPQSKATQPTQQLPFGLVDDSSDSSDWTGHQSNLDTKLDSLLFNNDSVSNGRTSALPGILPNDDVNFSQFDDQSFVFGAHDDSAVFDDEDDVDDHSPNGEADSHEKRKMSDDLDDGIDTNVKRQEGTEKVPKKPGRKPLTVEPTNKRKAQNRAAQRAFRDRKEKHMKDMETKVEELEKASEAANNENGLLRAKVDRLQMELRDYRKRLSMSSTNFSQAEPISNRLSAQLTGADDRVSNGFAFNFPHFGDLPSNVFNNNAGPSLISASPASMAPVHNGRSSSMAAAMASNRTNGRSSSPQSQRQSSLSSSVNGRSPPVIQSQADVSIESINNDGLAGLFASVSPPPSASQPPVNLRTESSSSNATAGHSSRIFQFNSNAGSVASPSVSSNSYGPCSSATSPESNRDSPAVRNKDANLNNANNQPSLFANSNVSLSPDAISDTISPSAFGLSNVKGIDWMAAQNGGQFDPTLFGDYRDSQTAIVGNGNFTGGFFDAALPVTDWSSPFNWDSFGNIPTGLTPAIQRNDPLATADLLSAGIEPVDTKPSQMRPSEIGCDKVWQRIAGNKDFQDGKFDVDDLCSELKKKARCSEAGVAIGQADVDAALARMPQKNPFNSSR